MQEATYLFRRPGELARALLAMNVLMPLFALGLISIFDLSPAVRIALVARSVSPIPPLLPTKLVKEGGTNSYAIGLLILPYLAWAKRRQPVVEIPVKT